MRVRGAHMSIGGAHERGAHMSIICTCSMAMTANIRGPNAPRPKNPASADGR